MHVSLQLHLRRLLLIQVCSDPTPMLSSTGFGKMHLPVSRALLQHRLTACLCHCSYTYEDLLLINLCIDTTAMLCSTGFGKMHLPVSRALLQHRLTACLCHCSYRFAAHKVVHRHNSNALQHWFWQDAFTTVQCCSAKQAHNMHVSLQLHLRRFAALTSVQ